MGTSFIPPPASRKEMNWSKNNSASTSSTGETSQAYNPLPTAATSGGGALGPQSAGAIYLHIHQIAAKRIATLDYLRKTFVVA